MFPVLFQIGSFRVASFGIILALGMFAGVACTARLMERRGVTSREAAYDLAFWAVLGALVGSRILFVVVQWRLYRDNPLAIFKFWEGGLVLYGGVLGALALGIWKARTMKLAVRRAFDCAMAGACLGIFFGRFACLAVGDDFGRPAPAWFPLAIRFTNPDSQVVSLHPELAGVPLYPTQVFMSLKGLTLFLLGRWLLKRNLPDGTIGYLILMGFAALRYLIEEFRGDLAERGTVLNGYLSTSQFLSIGIFLVVLVLLARDLKRARTPGNQPVSN